MPPLFLYRFIASAVVVGTAVRTACNCLNPSFFVLFCCSPPQAWLALARETPCGHNNNTRVLNAQQQQQPTGRCWSQYPTGTCRCCCWTDCNRLNPPFCFFFCCNRRRRGGYFAGEDRQLGRDAEAQGRRGEGTHNIRVGLRRAVRRSLPRFLQTYVLSYLLCRLPYAIPLVYGYVPVYTSTVYI